MAILQRLTLLRSLLLGFVICSFYYFFMYDSGETQKASIQNSQQQIVDLQKQIQDSQAKIDRAAGFKKTANDLGTTINKLLSVIPEKFGKTDLLKLISNEVKVAGSSLQSLAPGKSEVSSLAKEFEEINVSVDVMGTFLQHMVFLSNLTKVPQILIVKKFEFTSGSGESKLDESPQIHLVAEIVAYRYRGTEIKPEEPKK